jgi:hypothetical protein
MAGTNPDLLLHVGFDIDKFNAQLNKTTSLLSKWSAGVVNSLKGMAAGFGALSLGKFALDAAKLAGEAEGVAEAFNKLPNATRLMLELKDATGGTVSELNLMRRAVAFADFGLPLEQLGKFMQFATVQAQRTGKSVDYLVDSIVTGLGRKSVLILDNLGLSAAQINEEVAKTGDFFNAVGTIIDQRLSEAGGITDTTATKIQRLSASVENLQEAFGRAANSSGLLGLSISAVTTAVDVAAGKNLSWWEKLLAFSGGAAMIGAHTENIIREFERLAQEEKIQQQVIREVDRAFAEFNGNIEAYGKAITTHIYREQLLAEFTKRLTAAREADAKQVENIANLTEKLNGLQQMQLTLTGDSLAKTNREIEVINEKIKALRELGTVSSMPQRPPGLGGPIGDTGPIGQVSAADPLGWLADRIVNLKPIKGFTTETNEALDKLDEKSAQVANNVYMIASSLSGVFEKISTGAEKASHAFAHASGRIMSDLSRILLLKALDAALSDEPTKAFFPAKLALIGTALGVVGGILNRIGADSQGGIPISQVGTPGERVRLEQMGARVQLEPVKIEITGPKLTAWLKANDRYNSRTRPDG